MSFLYREVLHGGKNQEYNIEHIFELFIEILSGISVPRR